MTDLPETTDTTEDHIRGATKKDQEDHLPGTGNNDDQDSEEVLHRSVEKGPGTDNHESVNSDQDENGKSSDMDDEADTFPRSYVEKLRDENANYRQRAQKSDELAHRLHRALVEADGRLADPTDLEFTDEHLEDSEALTAAVDELLATKPHLAARRPAGNIGQGASGSDAGNVDLAGLLRAGAN